MVIQLAKDKPDTKSECRYFDTHAYNAPCCIVGHGLAALGVDVQPFASDSELNAWTSVDGLPDAGCLEMDDEVALLRLYNIQARQDKGDTWGEALTYAEQGKQDD